MRKEIAEIYSHFAPSQPYQFQIHNIGSSVSEYYELHAPYYISYQSCHSGEDIVTMINMAPSGYTCNSLSLKEAGFLKNRSLHQHDFFEVMFVLAGEITQRIEDKTYTYTTGQCCVLNRNVKHCESFFGDYEVVFLMLNGDFLKEVTECDIRYAPDGAVHHWFGSVYRLIQKNQESKYFDLKEYIEFSPLVSGEELEFLMNQFHRLINQMVEESSFQQPGCSFMMKGLISRFFSMLETPSFRKEDVCLSSKKEENILMRTAHLLELKDGRITRKELEKELNYSSDYVNRIVKKYTGMTLVEYGQIFCLKKAEILLCDGDMSIAEIVSVLGFSNRSYFYRMFRKRYGMTPNRYREIWNG